METADPDPRKLISVIVPVFNEEQNVERCYLAIRKEFEKLEKDYRLELFFSDNHSTDLTFDILKKIAAKDPDVRVIRLSRNFGFQKSLLTAYQNISGDAAIQIDADLQDPPSMFSSFLNEWSNGYDVVVGVREDRPEPYLLKLARKGFYRLLRLISDDEMIDDAGDFRLVDRSIISRLKTVTDARPYTRGLISSFSIKQKGIPYKRNSRKYGKSKFPVRRLFGFAIDGIVAHSLVPLRLATWVGVITFIVTVFLLIYYLVVFLFSGGNWPPGFATQTLLLLGSLALNAILIGILGEYVGRIYEQVRARPLTIIQERINHRSDNFVFESKSNEVDK